MTTFIGAAVFSKLYFVVLLLTWGALPEPIDAFLLYASHWPSLIAGAFPWFYDSHGTRGIDIMLGLTDLRSVLVNFLGQLVLLLCADSIYRRVKRSRSV